LTILPIFFYSCVGLGSDIVFVCYKRQGKWQGNKVPINHVLRIKKIFKLSMLSVHIRRVARLGIKRPYTCLSRQNKQLFAEHVEVDRDRVLIQGVQTRSQKSRGCSSIPSGIENIQYDRDVGIVTHNNQQYQTVIGLEIHAQLKISTKLFSLSATKHSRDDSTPNSLVHPFDMGYPGALPLLSPKAVQAAVLAAKALNCTIHPISRFERKHYHYPDLPLGYQVTQQRWPIASNGNLSFRLGWNSQQRKRLEEENKQVSPRYEVGVERIQIEQDTGKTSTNESCSLIDLNRAGCALIEVVFRPDLRSAHQAAACVASLQQLLRHVGVCDGKMEEGSLRCDLNVSIAPVESVMEEWAPANPDDSFNLPPNCGKRVEVKNLNSIRQGATL